jgi:hypothetical protein
MDLSLDLRINGKPLKEREEQKKGKERHSKNEGKNGQTASVV